ncbi:hypothetical protein K435DRAFT_835449 [Dendrothele bispora CBS 962.96]|uniref:F-box domain-containing protein n=1 Tax=Dendrothele bispora (strain CBS 962.96) TaxID=1314807 RepID=A0A4S8MN34_DENBC|nr:hypothetical protein K435DRAFT_835449 [Dendrothele bispora CBS 962.96]
MPQCSKCGSSVFHPRVSVDSQKIFQRLRDPVQATEEEAAYVNQIQHDAESDFASYDAEIAQLEAAISVLKHKRKCLQDYVAKHRSLLAPIRRLPPEVLSLIFLTYCHAAFEAAIGEILQLVYRRCSSLVIDCGYSQRPVHTPGSIASIPDMPCLEYLRLPAGVLMEDWSPALPIYQAPRPPSSS